MVQTAKVGGHDVFVKPGGQFFDPQTAIKDHHAVAQSAIEMGCGHMVMPATLTKDNKKRDAFVTKSAGSGFGVATRNPAACEKVSEHDKLAGALIDHLHSNPDRHSNNVLVHNDGRIVLIDHDYCHKNGGMRSVFTMSTSGIADRLVYKSEQKSIADLPPKMQEHVRNLAGSTDKEVAKKYQLEPVQASMLRRRASYIVEHGLDKSIEDL